jgi:hypothetical protein
MEACNGSGSGFALCRIAASFHAEVEFAQEDSSRVHHLHPAGYAPGGDSICTAGEG